MRSQSEVTASARLLDRLDSILANDLGAMPVLLARAFPTKSLSPVANGFESAFISLVLFCALPFGVGLVFKFKPAPPIEALSLWASGYIGFAVFMARQTNANVRSLIATGILPSISGAMMHAIEADLTTRFRPLRVHLISLAVALAGIAVSAAALWYDLLVLNCGYPYVVPQLLWFFTGFFVLYLTATRVTDCARFYAAFARHLYKDRDRIYTVDPVHSVLVMQISALGRHILLFWAAIASAILMMFVVFLWWRLTWFVLIVVPVTTFFSIGFGTFVFLASEFNIAKVVGGVRDATLRRVEEEADQLAAHGGTLDTPQHARLLELTAFHEKLAAAGIYRSFLPTALSLAAPLAGPALSILVAFIVPRGH